MQRAIKIRIKPTKKQETLFWKSAGTARWSYNYFLGRNQENYELYLANGKQGKSFLNNEIIRKEINNELKPTTHKWLREVSSNVMKQAVKDCEDAFKRFFKGESDYPKFKSKHKSKPSFYVNYESFKWQQKGFKGEKLGFVHTTKDLPKLKNGCKYSNPRITHDGRYWYISVGYKTEDLKNIKDKGKEIAENDTLKDLELVKELDLTSYLNYLTNYDVIGIDLGVKDLAVCSNGDVYKNINKTKRVRKLEKSLKHEQKKLSRMLKYNIESYTECHKKNKYGKDIVVKKPVWKRPLKECANIQRQNKKINKIHKHLTDIRQNYIHQITNRIVKTKPSKIVMEDLNVKGMMKNRHLSKSIASQKFFEFKRQIRYKCESNGIEFKEAKRFYPSSKKCSCCGTIKKDLKLKDRIYICEECELKIDRDLNASLNLANCNPKNYKKEKKKSV